jgi:formylglycine-generating enzyme required for sulfatase activity
LDEADELTAVALSLIPEDPQTVDVLNRLRIERRENLVDEIERGDVARAWRDWKKLRPSDEAEARGFDREIGLQPLRVISVVPATRVLFHAQHPDGRPNEGPPLYELTAGPPESASERLDRTFQADLKIIPGAYWVTAFVDGSAAFVERPFEVKRDRWLESVSQVIQLYPKTTPEAAAGMSEIQGGDLKMGSNETLPGQGVMRIAPPEYPEHEVTVPGFYLDRTEVTNRAFMAFLVKTGREAWGANIWPETGGRPESDHLDWPVTRVRRDEAVEFAAWRGCTLPDEAQLEWAARGPDGLTKPKPLVADASSQAWAQIHAVDSDPLDRTDLWSQPILGLFGNAGEMTLFRFRPYPHQDRYLSGSSARLGFTVRSGSFQDSLTAKLFALGYIKRASLIPEARNSHVGFRCARAIETRINVSSSRTP